MANNLITAAILVIYLSSNLDISNYLREDYNSFIERRTQQNTVSSIPPLTRGCPTGLFRLDSLKIDWGESCTRQTRITIKITNHRNFELEAETYCHQEHEAIINGIIPGQYDVSIRATENNRVLTIFQQPQRDICVRTMQENIVRFTTTNSQTTS